MVRQAGAGQEGPDTTGLGRGRVGLEIHPCSRCPLLEGEKPLSPPLIDPISPPAQERIGHTNSFWD